MTKNGQTRGAHVSILGKQPPHFCVDYPSHRIKIYVKRHRLSVQHKRTYTNKPYYYHREEILSLPIEHSRHTYTRDHKLCWIFHNNFSTKRFKFSLQTHSESISNKNCYCLPGSNVAPSQLHVLRVKNRCQKIRDCHTITNQHGRRKGRTDWNNEKQRINGLE